MTRQVHVSVDAANHSHRVTSRQGVPIRHPDADADGAGANPVVRHRSKQHQAFCGTQGCREAHHRLHRANLTLVPKSKLRHRAASPRLSSASSDSVTYERVQAMHKTQANGHHPVPFGLSAGCDRNCSVREIAKEGRWGVGYTRKSGSRSKGQRRRRVSRRFHNGPSVQGAMTHA
jgi:hypothetical protein